jgi:hypothetical protein
LRDFTATLEDAVENTAGIKPIIKAVIEPSRIFFDSVTFNNPWSGSDGTGIDDDPTLQEIAYSSVDDLLVTFLNNAGTLSYTKQGTATKVSLSLDIDGKPGVHSSRLYRIDGLNVYRHVITWTGPSLGCWYTNQHAYRDTACSTWSISYQMCSSNRCRWGIETSRYRWHDT